MPDSPQITVARAVPAPRARRRAAGVIAQYIQDLSRASEPVPCAAA
jgi:hypothetical protein